MLSERMYVRCPADIESATDPRVFVCGQVIRIDDFKKTVTVKIHDPFHFLLFFEDMPKGSIDVPISMVDHCSLFIGTDVIVKGELCKILSEQCTCAQNISHCADQERRYSGRWCGNCEGFQ